MNRMLPIGLALALLATATAPGLAQSDAGRAGVRDQARLFSPEAARRADRALQALRRETKWEVVIETVASLDGEKARDRAIADAKRHELHGLIVLISKEDHQLWVEPSHSAEGVFSKDRVKAIRDALSASFKERKFDEGLQAAVAQVRRDAGVSPEPAEEPKRASPAPAAPAAGRPEPPVRAPEVVVPPGPQAQPGVSLMPLILLGVGVLVFLWLLSRAFRRPEQPAYGGPAPGMAAQPQPFAPTVPPTPTTSPTPGYGPAPRPSAPVGYPQAPPQAANPGYYPGPGYAAPPPQQAGGGGFVSGALGGLGGAIVGNILYDQFGRPHHAPEAPPMGGVHHGGGMAPSPVHPADDVAPPPSETYDPNAGAGADWGSPEPAQPSQPDNWSGSGDAGAGADWGAEASAPEPDTGAGSDWSSAEESAPPDDGGGDWGGADDSGAGGGDWGGDDQGQGGSW